MYLEKKRYMEAMVVAKKGKKAHSRDPAIRLILAQVYAAQRKDEQAMSELEELLKVAPQHAQALALRETLRVRLG